MRTWEDRDGRDGRDGRDERDERDFLIDTEPLKIRRYFF